MSSLLQKCSWGPWLKQPHSPLTEGSTLPLEISCWNYLVRREVFPEYVTSTLPTFLSSFLLPRCSLKEDYKGNTLKCYYWLLSGCQNGEYFLPSALMYMFSLLYEFVLMSKSLFKESLARLAMMEWANHSHRRRKTFSVPLMSAGPFSSVNCLYFGVCSV